MKRSLSESETFAIQPEVSNRRAIAQRVATAALSALALFVGLASAAEPEALTVEDSSFTCLSDMVKVRHFFVDNLLGDRDATIEVAQRGEGAYPPGSVVQLIPGEVMVKHPQGFNVATNDWEFFELDVSSDGSQIRKRGFADVVNRFGGNCFACHVKARAEFDLICEQDHGCDPIPITRQMLAALQKTDPRCPNPAPLNEDEQLALKDLAAILQAMSSAAAKP